MKPCLALPLALLLIGAAAIAQTAPTPKPTPATIYKLADGVTLQSLPLDTVFAKLDIATNEMTGPTDPQVKQDVRQTLTRAEATRMPLFIAKAHQQIANWHSGSMSSENPDSIYFHNQKALLLFLQTNDKEAISEAYKTVGDNLEQLQRFAQAEVQYFKGLRLAEAIKSPKIVNSIYAALARLYYQTKDFGSALKYSQLAVSAYQQDGETLQQIRALIVRNNIYIGLKQPEKALATVNQALALLPKMPADLRAEESYNLRAWRGKAYRALGRYDEALADFEYAWKGIQGVYGAANANGWKGDVGSIYFLRGQYARAVPYLKAYINHLKNRKVYFPEELQKHYVWLAESYKALGQPDSAYVYAAGGNALEVNALRQRNETLRKELLIKYETEQKDQTIAQQSGQIEQQRQIQRLSYGIGGLLVLLLASAFFSYRNSQKSARQLQALNENLATTNAALDKRNAENELLLKEIHHRVKNNLEVVSSLLALQSAKITDPNVQEAMQASQNRVQSMGIIHQKLYQGEQLAAIEMRDYFQNLSESILDSFDAAGRVNIDCAMPELVLDIDTAISVGLITNELLTNSLKYAFVGKDSGSIRISLTRRPDDDSFLLQVADNGVGKLPGDPAKGTGFGTQLIDLLTRQLGGTLTYENQNGTLVNLRFTR